MQLTHKIRLDPTAKQRQYFVRAAGTSRFVYNWALEQWRIAYENGDKPNGNSLKKQFNAMYHETYPWVGEVHRDCHSQPFADVQKAYVNFFQGRAKAPKFKSRKDRRSFYVANDKFRVTAKHAVLPVIGKVRMREALRFVGKISSARVVEDAGEWFLCVAADVGEIKKSRIGNGVVGVDLGIKTLVTLSDGRTVANPKPLRRAQRRLARAQRRLSRRVKGSNNRKKQRQVVAKIHSRVRNIRHDVLHKVTTSLCRENQAVVIEDLTPSNMVKNHCLAKAISDASFGLFRQLLTYKAQLYGTRLIVADRFYPSSKTCSACGRVKGLLTLNERMYHCTCGLSLDRDLNAARNLVQLATACGEVTPVELSSDGVEAGTKPCVLVRTKLESRMR